ncbi:MAG: hypothetical protein MZW92_36285 [Comamonadaceae bacterium]|nr:hypothetical protein [Comamonadaceae bacterium]
MADDTGVARLSWIQDGAVLSAEDYAKARGVPVESLAELEREGELFSLDVAGGRWYPAELLKVQAEEAGAVCGELAGDDSARQLIFWMRRHGALGDRTVAEAVAAGLLQHVPGLAREWRY